MLHYVTGANPTLRSTRKSWTEYRKHLREDSNKTKENFWTRGKTKTFGSFLPRKGKGWVCNSFGRLAKRHFKSATSRAMETVTMTNFGLVTKMLNILRMTEPEVDRTYQELQLCFNGAVTKTGLI